MIGFILSLISGMSFIILNVSGQNFPPPLTTEEETALFKPQGYVKIQLRVGIGEKRMNSRVLMVTVYDVLKDGLLSEISGGDTQ